MKPKKNETAKQEYNVMIYCFATKETKVINIKTDHLTYDDPNIPDGWMFQNAYRADGKGERY